MSYEAKLAKVRGVAATAPAPAQAEGGPVSLRANAAVEITAAKGEGKRPTFAIHGYTGAPLYLSGFYSPVIVDLAGLKTAGQEIPVLLEHDPSQIVGQTTKVTVGSDGARMEGTVTGENDPAREVVSQARNGFKWQASIGASIDRREFLDAGKKATVNGREVAGPMVIARESTLREISFVALGADGATSATVAASNPSGTHSGASTMQFDEWLKAKGFDPAALNDGQKATLKAAFDAEQKPAAASHAPAAGSQSPAAATLDEILAAQRAEDARVQKITEITAAAIKARPALIDRFEALSKAAIANGSDVQAFELAALRLRADSGPAVHSPAGRSESIAQQPVIEAAVCRAGRLSNIEKHFSAPVLEAADKHFRHGIGLQELLLIGAAEGGYHGRTVSDLESVLRACFRPEIRADGGMSMLSIPGTLSNVMNKFLVDFFNNVESGWRAITAIRNVRDFKQVSSYSLTGDLQYDKVGPTGEIKHGTLGEQTYTNQASTYARMLAITRTDIINDDLGALMRVPQRLGRGAGLKMNDVIWTAFLAGVGTFWTSGRANLISGGTTALDVTNGAVALTAALKTFRKQTDPDGKPLGVSPSVLLVPPELETMARTLMNSQFYVAGGGSSASQIPSTNTWQGAYQVAMSSYLSNTSYTGYSTTAWYLLANPADLPTIELAVLNGREVPIIESAEANFDTLGIRVRGYHDFGATLQEYRGSVRSAGA